ncbi:hypothetical protein AB7M75_002132 [Bradyrhizobium ottawaense]
MAGGAENTGSFGTSRCEVAPRQRSSTALTKCMSWPEVTEGTLLMVASPRGNWCGGTSLKRNRVGSATPSPKASTSRVPSEGTKESRFAAASDTAARSSAWSRSLARRIVNSVLHWEMMVASSSAGRWVMRPR